MNAALIKKIAALRGLGVVAWALCGSIISIGREITPLQNTLIAHAIGVAIIFGIASWIYFRKCKYTTPLQTAGTYVLLATVLDLSIVAPLIERGFAMFASVLGMWIPLASIFLSTYVVGILSSRAVLGVAPAAPTRT